MINKPTIALSVAVICGAASAALANDGGENRGGFVIPGSMDGVNPTYHSGWFPNYVANTAGESYGYIAAPKAKHRSSRK